MGSSLADVYNSFSHGQLDHGPPEEYRYKKTLQKNENKSFPPLHFSDDKQVILYGLK